MTLGRMRAARYEPTVPPLSAAFSGVVGMLTSPRIGIIGLGYVGLPLAVHLARHFDVVGFDIDGGRVAELRDGMDRTDEISREDLQASALTITDQETALDGLDVFIVTVPTPVDSENRPDLSAVHGASETVARHIRSGAIVVYESTVYPGVTEDECGPILAQGSGLTCGEEFFLGYSPERINPGDREHTVDQITKIVAGQTPAVTDKLAEIYGA
jgi:UDP-N-acetyl-D-galactosamine dehydrogenase